MNEESDFSLESEIDLAEDPPGVPYQSDTNVISDILAKAQSLMDSRPDGFNLNNEEHSRELEKFIDEVLTDDEREYLGASELGPAVQEMRVVRLVEMMDIEFAKAKSQAEFSNGILEMPLNLRARFVHQELSYSEYASGEFQNRIPYQALQGREGLLLLGDYVVGKGRLDDAGEILEISSEGISVPDPLKDIVQVELTVEIGRTIVDLRDVLELHEGSVLELDEPLNERQAILMEGLLVAWGETVTINENMGVRVLDLVDGSIVEKNGLAPDQALRMSTRRHRTFAGLTCRAVLGSTRIYIQELAGLGEGSIIELDTLAGEPIRLEFENGVRLYGEVVVMDQNYGVRIQNGRYPEDPIFSGGQNEMPPGHEDVSSADNHDDWLKSLENLRHFAEEKLGGLGRDANEIFRRLENLTINGEDDGWFDPSADGSDAEARNDVGIVHPPFRRILQAKPEELLALLRNEHPQTIAVVLARLDAETAGRILTALNEDLRGDVVRRIAQAKAIPQTVLDIMDRDLAARLANPIPENNVGGTEPARRILGALDAKTRASIKEKLDEDTGQALFKDDA